MKQLRLLYGMAVSALLALGSCASETDFAPSDPANRTEGVATVYFKLGGSAAPGVITRATDESQSANEKKVASLLVVIFRDKDGNISSGENDADTFYRAIALSESNLTPEQNGKIPLTLDLDDAANFQFTFVANPGEELKNTVTTWNSSENKTVKDFKQLVVDVAPDAKNMLMTSAFKGITLNWNSPADLGEILMTRAMARIDIVNLAAGVTIDNLTFGKRAVKTVLINDGQKHTSTDYLEKQEKKYEFNGQKGLEGNPEASSAQGADAKCSCTSTIYTYEQYNHDNHDKTNAPSLKLAFHTLDAGGQKITGEHVVSLSALKDTPIFFERNHLYRILVSSSNGAISLKMTVADWNGGEEFDVSREEIIAGMGGIIDPYANVRVGDIFLNDGTLVDASQISEEQKKKAVGIVFQTNKDRIGQTAKTAGFTHGLVIALKNANNDRATQWSEDQVQKGELKGQRKLAYQDIDGLGNTRNTNLKDLAAFKAATAYNTTCALPKGKTSNWYLPAMGELMDLAANLGGLDIERTSDSKGVKESTETSVAVYTSKVTEVGNKINGYLSKVGEGNYHEFPAADYASNYRFYWSSSEYSAAYAWSLSFSSNGDLNFGNGNKTNTVTHYRVRCVFAF